MKIGVPYIIAPHFSLQYGSSMVQKVIAPETIPTPRFTDERQIEYNVSNHPILETISKKNNTAVELPETPEVKPTSKFYALLNTSERIEIDYGSDFQIEVQPDMRYVAQYLMFTTSHEYAELEIKGYPYVSLPSLVAYKLTIFIGHFLISDLTYRRERSFSSAPYTNDAELMELLSTLKTCPVPQDVQTILDHIAPVQDSQRCNLKSIPSFAAFSFKHDFGYSVPISTFLSIHDILASNRTSSEPGIIMAMIYNTVLTRIGTSSCTISNLFGGPYSYENDTYQHRNWFCTALEAFINPVVSRALVQRPTFLPKSKPFRSQLTHPLKSMVTTTY